MKFRGEMLGFEFVVGQSQDVVALHPSSFLSNSASAMVGIFRTTSGRLGMFTVNQGMDLLTSGSKLSAVSGWESIARKTAWQGGPRPNDRCNAVNSLDRSPSALSLHVEMLKSVPGVCQDVWRASHVWCTTLTE